MQEKSENCKNFKSVSEVECVAACSEDSFPKIKVGIRSHPTIGIDIHSPYSLSPHLVAAALAEKAQPTPEES